MRISTLKSALLAMVVAAAVPLGACSGTPTSATQLVVGADFTKSGVINTLDRSGTAGIDVRFRIGDEPFLRADVSTTVLDGSITGDTTFLRSGYNVTVEGKVEARDLVYIRRVVINSK